MNKGDETDSFKNERNEKIKMKGNQQLLIESPARQMADILVNIESVNNNKIFRNISK